MSTSSYGSVGIKLNLSAISRFTEELSPRKESQRKTNTAMLVRENESINNAVKYYYLITRKAERTLVTLPLTPRENKNLSHSHSSQLCCQLQMLKLPHFDISVPLKTLVLSKENITLWYCPQYVGKCKVFLIITQKIGYMLLARADRWYTHMMIKDSFRIC